MLPAGSLYHHFGSKSGLYLVVRTDVELRVLDRMEGAAAVAAGDRSLRPADVALVGFDYLVRSGYARLLSTPRPDGSPDPLEAFFSTLADRDGAPVGRLLHAAWRTALADVAAGGDAGRIRRAFSLLA